MTDSLAGSQVDDCVFCAIVAGQAPSSMVYQNDLVAAFMDIQPVNPGHLLIVPRVHAVGLADLPVETGQTLLTVAHRTAAAIRASGIRCDGLNLFLADGVAAGQEVFHVHLHVIPRVIGDGFRLRVDYPPAPDRGQLDAAANDIASWLR